MLRVIGHRGARTLAVENSLLSLRAAADAGADGVEIDVQLSADGEPVVFHDDDLLRLCAIDAPLRRLAWKELRALRAAEAGLVPQPIAHLDAVLEWWPAQRLGLNVELKVAAGAPAPMARRLAEVVAARLAGMPAEHLVVSSFSGPALAAFAERLPTLRRAALIEAAPPCDFWPVAARPSEAEGPFDQVHPHVGLLDDARLGAFAARRWPVWTWTVNDPGEWERLLPLAHAAQLHGLISDHPGALRRFIERHAPELRAD